MKIILFTIAISFAVAFALGFLLGLFKKIFAVYVDPKVQQVRDCLSGANCGGCGYPGCDGLAAAIVAGKAPANGCPGLGKEGAAKIGKIMGVEVTVQKKVAVLACQGTKDCAAGRGHYTGIKSCRSAVMTVNGTKMCSFGCSGLGDCVQACKHGALSMGPDGLPKVNKEKCVGCGKCAQVCPKKLFVLYPADLGKPVALCANRSDNKPSIRKNCTSGCFKCGKCVRECPVQAIKMVNEIPVIDYELCTNCGTCVAGCVDKVFQVI